MRINEQTNKEKRAQHKANSGTPLEHFIVALTAGMGVCLCLDSRPPPPSRRAAGGGEGGESLFLVTRPALAWAAHDSVWLCVQGLPEERLTPQQSHFFQPRVGEGKACGEVALAA